MYDMFVAQTLPVQNKPAIATGTAEPLPQIRWCLAIAGDEEFQNRGGPWP